MGVLKYETTLNRHCIPIKVVEEYISPTPFIVFLSCQFRSSCTAAYDAFDFSTFFQNCELHFCLNFAINSTPHLLLISKICECSWSELVPFRRAYRSIKHNFFCKQCFLLENNVFLNIGLTPMSLEWYAISEFSFHHCSARWCLWTGRQKSLGNP